MQSPHPFALHPFALHPQLHQQLHVNHLRYLRPILLRSLLQARPRLLYHECPSR